MLGGHMPSSKLKSFFLESYYIVTKHNMNCMSAQLTYAVIVTIVPFFAVIFAFIHSRRNFVSILDNYVDPFIVDNFGSNIGIEISEYVRTIILKIQITDISIISFASFLITVILLLLLLESIFNALLDAKDSQKYVISLLKCWLLLVCSPFLFILSTLRSQFLLAVLDVTKKFVIREDIKFLTFTFGYLSQVMFFALLYYIMPSRRPKFTAAILGGFITTVALDALRYVNIFLVKHALAADTSQIYGSIPLIAILFFVWLRLVIFMVLIGFVFTTAYERVYHKHKRVKSA